MSWGWVWGCYDSLCLILTKKTTCLHLDRLFRGVVRVMCGLGWELCIVRGEGGGRWEGWEGLSCSVGDACSMLSNTCGS